MQECMQRLVGIIRTEAELKRAADEIAVLRDRVSRVKVEGNRQYNPAWHQALDLHALLTVSETVTVAALERKESRGGHAREDYPKMDPKFGKVNVVVRKVRGEITVSQEPLPEMPDDLKGLLEGEK